MEELLSVSETARELGVTSTVIYRLIKRGELNPARVETRGQQVLRFFRRSEVEALKRQRATQTEPM